MLGLIEALGLTDGDILSLIDGLIEGDEEREIDGLKLGERD